MRRLQVKLGYLGALKNKGASKGFALPTVLLASVVMMVVLLSALTSVSSISQSIRNQYYNQVANEASESGVALATACINKNNDTVTWTNAKPLRPGTDCNGDYIPGCSATTCFVLNTSLVQSTFSVPFPETDAYGGYKIVATASTTLLRTSGLASTRVVARTSGGFNKYVNNPEIGGGAGFQENGHIGFFKTADGLLYGFGDNSSNQINDDADLTVEKAFKMNLPTDVVRVKTIITSGQGASIICIIGQNDQLWCRGKPGGGPTEVGLMAYTNGWQKFTIPTNPSVAIVSATISGQGGDTLCAITINSEMYCAGDNQYYGGQGFGLLGNASASGLQIVPIDQAVKFSTRSDYKRSYNQDRYVCGITTTDDMYCAGNNEYGTLGNNTTVTPPAGTVVRYPLPVSRKVADVISSYHRSDNYILHVLATDGTIWGSGENEDGELGKGSVGSSYVPVQFGTRTDYAALYGGSDHFCGITSAGDVYCAGSNTSGQIGAGIACSATDVLTPTKVLLPTGEKSVTSLTAQNRTSPFATIILTQTGNIYSAGDNTYGRFGIGTTSACVTNPVKMLIPSSGLAKSVSTTDAYSVYLMSSTGKPYAAGRNNVGQLGDGSLTNRASPQPVILPRQTIVY